MTPLLLEAQNISHSFGTRRILDHVSLSLAAGEIVSLIGPNGAGKTTLVKILLGLEKPNAGQILRQSDLRIGYIPQKITPDPLLPLTVERFLQLWPQTPMQTPTKALEQTGARALLKRQIATLSGGELQRVMLARALLNNPQLLVMDEPAQGLDVHAQAALYDLIGQLRDQQGTAILMVSHDLHVVMAKAERVLCLYGHICCEGHPEAVSRDPAYAALFGSSAAAFALYKHHHNHHHDGAIACQHSDHTHHDHSSCNHG